MAMERKGKLILVTGATGYIGSHLTRELLKQAARVRALVRNPAKASALEHLGAEIRTADFTQPSTLEDAVKGCNLIFPVAGTVNEFKPYSYYWAVNVEGTRALAEAAIEARVEQFVHISSVWVYGADAGMNINESSPHMKSGFPYADTKLEGERVMRRLIEEQGLPAIIVQPSEVYGPWDPSWIVRPLDMIKKGKRVLVDGGEGLIQPIYIDDVVEGILAAARKGAVGQSYIICGSEAVTLREFFGYHARMLRKTRLPSVPTWLALTVATPSEWESKILRVPPIFTRQEVRITTVHAAYNGGKAQRELGFAPNTSLPEGMRWVEEWVRSRPSYRKPSAPAGCRFEESPRKGQGYELCRSRLSLHHTAEAAPAVSPFPPGSGHTSVSCPHRARSYQHKTLWPKSDCPHRAFSSGAETHGTTSSRSAPSASP